MAGSILDISAVWRLSYGKYGTEVSTEDGCHLKMKQRKRYSIYAICRGVMCRKDMIICSSGAFVAILKLRPNEIGIIKLDASFPRSSLYTQSVKRCLVGCYGLCITASGIYSFVASLNFVILVPTCYTSWLQYKHGKLLCLSFRLDPITGTAQGVSSSFA